MYISTYLYIILFWFFLQCVHISVPSESFIMLFLNSLKNEAHVLCPPRQQVALWKTDPPQKDAFPPLATQLSSVSHSRPVHKLANRLASVRHAGPPEDHRPPRCPRLAEPVPRPAGKHVLKAAEGKHRRGCK